MRLYTSSTPTGLVTIIAALAMAILVGAVPSTAWSQAFRLTEFNCTPSGTVTYDIRGVGNTDLCVVAAIEVTAECACLNRGGQCPDASNKEDAELTVSDSQVVQVRNGRIVTPDTGLTLTAPGDAFCAGIEGEDEEDIYDCRGGQRPVLADVDFEDTGSLTACTDFVRTVGGCTCTGGFVQGINDVELNCGPGPAPAIPQCAEAP